MSKASGRIFVSLVSFFLFAAGFVMSAFAQATPFFNSGNLVVAVEGCGVYGGTCTSVPNGTGTGSGNSSVGGYGDNQGSPLTLFQYTPAGTSGVTFVNSLVLPQTGSGADFPVSSEYGSSSEATLHLSGTGQFLTIMGYGVNAAAFNSNPGSYSPTSTNTALGQSGSQTGQSYTAVPRVLTLIDANGNVNSSTAVYNIFNTNNPRSAFTLNGTTAYLSGQGASGDKTGGVYYTQVGAPNNAPTAITGADATSNTVNQDTRDVQIYNNTLYVSVDTKAGSGSARDFIGTLGTPPATGPYLSGAGPTQLTDFASSSAGKEAITTGANGTGNGLNAGLQINLSPVNYFFASPSVLYVADSGAPKNNSASSPLGDGGLQKWVNSASNGSGTWSLAYTLYQGLNLVTNSSADGTTGLYGLTGTVSGSTVLLYATNYTIADLDTTYLYGITDSLSYTLASQASSETFTVLDTAPADSNFKGVSFAPTIPAGNVVITGTPSSSTYGQSVTFTASVTSTGLGTPTGTVTFISGSTTLCNAVATVGGVATCASGTLPPGTDTVTANYSGDANFAAGSGSTLQVVFQSASTTTLVSSLNPSLTGQQVTFTATVAGQYGGTPTGTVTFSDGATVLGTSPLTGSTATFSTAALPIGANSIGAAYSGDANFTGGVSQTLSEGVGALGPVSLQANVAGSSGFWLEAGQAAYTLGGTTTTCAWTSTNTQGGNYTVDSRSLPGTPFAVDYGALWVTWTPGTAGGSCAAPDGTSQVWAYINLDAVLGVRCLFAQPQCTLNTSAAAGTPGANALPGINDTPLPAAILATFNGQPISIAASDILPVDAKFSTYSTLSQCGGLGKGTQYIGLGYGPGPLGTLPIYSAFTWQYFNINDFNVYGIDPISQLPVPSYTINPVGAIPVVVAVNSTNPSGFGTPALTNINRAQLGLMFTLIFGRTVDALPQAFAGLEATYYPVTALIPEPLSGEYNVFEHSIANNKELYRSQDIDNCDPYAPPTDPLIDQRTIGGTVSSRMRTIGTAETLTELQSVQDSIGYAFWSAENFAGTSGIKYVTVDGVDPLKDTYTDGTLPQGADLANVTLSHVADGSYPLWNEERLISYGSPAAATLQSYVQAQVSFGAGATHPDFIPDSQLNVFHSHFAPVDIVFNATNTPSDGPKVCGNGSSPEDGGDVGGLVLGLQAGADYCIMKGNYGAPGAAGNPNGPTSEASFGIRQ